MSGEREGRRDIIEIGEMCMCGLLIFEAHTCIDTRRKDGRVRERGRTKGRMADSERARGSEGRVRERGRRSEGRVS